MKGKNNFPIVLATLVAIKVLIQVGAGWEGRVPDLPFAIAMTVIPIITWTKIAGPYTGAVSMAIIAIAGSITGLLLRQGIGFLVQDVGLILGLLTYHEFQRVRRLPKH